VRRAQGAVAPSTLAEAHDVLWRQRPAAYADASEWITYHRHSAKVYAQAAEVDERHRYEALQCAGLAIRKARDLEHQLDPEGDES
jgi:hypothetical protein